MIYFDNAATTQHKPEAVLQGIQHAMEHCASVGRSGHRLAINAAEAVYSCRSIAAKMFDTSPERVCFTFNATHGLNIAIRSVIKPGDTVVISGFEHNAVVRPLYSLEANIVVAGDHLMAPEEIYSDFESKIKNETKAVICTHVSNVFGNILPVERIADLCYKNDIPFILDASQSAGILPISMEELHAAFVAMPGHKGLYGPQGTGILLCGEMPEPVLYGGTGSVSEDMEMPRFVPDRVEAGTHNVPGICGLEEGIRFVLDAGLKNVLDHEIELRNCISEEMKTWDKIRLIMGETERRTGVLSFQVQNMDCERVAEILSDRDIAVRAGLHCSPLAHRSAGTIREGTVRISFSIFNNFNEADRFLAVMKDIADNKILA